MNTGKNYNKMVYGSKIQKLTTGISTVKEWLNHPDFKESHKRANRSKIVHSIDFLYSVAVYGATLQDFLVFEFYNKSKQERKSYVTAKAQHKLFDKVNNKSKTDIFKDKNVFTDVFEAYTGREIFKLDMNGNNIAEAVAWLSNKEIVFGKPSNGVQGRGVTRLIVENDPEQIVHYCLDQKLDIIEEAIEQHPKMKALHPDSINTVRFITLVDNDNVKILGTSMRMGVGTHVDNGGVYVSINAETGIVDSIAYTNFGEKYEKHPITNHELIGFQVPLWKEVIELCKKAALEVDDVRCVGWDVAITENGPLIIEGNDRWSRFLWQLPKQKGLFHTIKDYL